MATVRASLKSSAFQSRTAHSRNVVAHMKKLALLVLMLTILGCRPASKNDAETLEKIFASSSFDIDLLITSSWGNPEFQFNVSAKDDYYLIKLNGADQVERLEVATIDSLKRFLIPRIGRELGGFCTNGLYVRIGTFLHSVDYSHQICSGPEGSALQDLLGLDRFESEKEN